MGALGFVYGFLSGSVVAGVVVWRFACRVARNDCFDCAFSAFLGGGVRDGD